MALICSSICLVASDELDETGAAGATYEGVCGTTGMLDEDPPKISLIFCIVAGPTLPTVGKPYLAWNFFTAAVVLGP